MPASIGRDYKQNYLLIDEFSGVDGANLSSRAPDVLNRPTVGWSVQSGTWEIRSGRARAVGSSDQWSAVLNLGVADVLVEVDIEVVGVDGGVILRATNDSNYFVFTFNAGTNEFTAYKREGGAFTLMQNILKSWAAGERVRVACIGNQFTSWTQVGGVWTVRHSFTHTFNNTATRFGIRDSSAGGAEYEYTAFRAWASRGM